MKPRVFLSHSKADTIFIERLGWEVQDVADGFRVIPKTR